MDENAMVGRVNLAEIQSIFGVQIRISVDSNLGLYHIMVSKEPIYKHNVLTESMVKDMDDESLMLAMKNFAKEVFDEYCKHIF